MADRDVTVDVLMRDKTGPAIISVERNLKRANKEAERSTSAIGKIADQWGRGFSRIGGAASRWANSGDSAGKKFVRGIEGGISAISKVGGAIGDGLSKAVSAAGPYVQVAVGTLLVGAAMAAAPAMAGAIVGSAAAGGIVGGVLLASKDARVAGAIDDLKEEVGSGLQDAAKRFIPATLDAADRARAAFNGLLPDLRRIFDVSATWLGPLMDSIGNGTRSLLSGITAAVTKAGPIIAVVGDGIQRMLDSVGDGFRMLADNGASMALALKIALFVVEVAIRGTFFVLNVLVEAFEMVAKVVPGLRGKLDDLKNGQDGAKTSAFNLAGGFQALASDANGAAAGLTNAKQKADEFTNSNISLGRAQIASREAIRTATSALQENSKAKLNNQQRSDRNMTALYNLADAFNAESDAGDRSGVSANQASNAYANNRAKLVAMAEKAGYSKDKANELAAALLKIPKNVRTDINADTGAAKAAVESFQKQVNNLKGKTVTVTVRVQSNGDHYIPGVGTQLKNSGMASWKGTDGSDATSRTGGPRQTVKLDNTVNVSLDGQPFYAYTARAINESERRTEWRQKVGRR